MGFRLVGVTLATGVVINGSDESCPMCIAGDVKKTEVCIKSMGQCHDLCRPSYPQAPNLEVLCVSLYGKRCALRSSEVGLAHDAHNLQWTIMGSS